MPSFFPPPFPFFRPNNNYYRPIKYPQYFQNQHKINNINSQHNQYEAEEKQDISTKNTNSNNNYSNNPNANTNLNNQKNSITNTSNDSNTISSLFPLQFSNFLPTNIGPLNININGFTNTDEPIFELFGIHLYLDDIIIVCILIFLFQEDVKDEMLFIILIMLLFS